GGVRFLDQVPAGGGPQHAALRGCPVPGPRPQENVQPLPPPGQLPTVLFDAPEGNPFSQQQFHAPLPGLPLLAGQPLPKRRTQVIVRQRVTGTGSPPPPTLSPQGGEGRVRGGGGGWPLLEGPFWVGRRHQPQLRIQDVQQVGKLLRAAGVPRRL